MSCFTCYGRQYRLRASRSVQRGFASLDSPPSPAGASGAGVAGCGPEFLPPGIAWGAPAASRGRVLALWAAGRTNPLTRHPLDGTATDVVWPEEVSRAGPEAAARSAAQGTGEDPGRSLHP